MKTKLSGALIATIFFIGIAIPDAQALSCIDPQGMIEYYINTDDYTIFTAKAGETKEFVKEAADTTGLDPNMQYDSGYTGQFVEVSKAYKGYPDAMQWVYYEKNSTWGYMCASGPAKAGQETLYIVSYNNGMFSLPQVVNSYPADSKLALDIIAALKDADTDNEPVIAEVSVNDWQNRLRTDILEMVFLIKIKLSELTFWMNR